MLGSCTQRHSVAALAQHIETHLAQSMPFIKGTISLANVRSGPFSNSRASGQHNMVANRLLESAADIVVAHISNNCVPADEVPTLIRSVYASLVSAGTTRQADAIVVPAVCVRSSVKSDAIACLECGARFKMLKRHLSQDHGLTPGEYRERWSLKADYPMVAPAYSSLRRHLAMAAKLGHVERIASNENEPPQLSLSPDTIDVGPAGCLAAPGRIDDIPEVALQLPAAIHE